MSVIKRLGNVARGKYLEWSDDPTTDDPQVVRELAELEAAAAAAASSGGSGPQAVAHTPAPALRHDDPQEAKREAIVRAHAAGVISVDERDAKLDALERDRYAPPKPKKRTL